MVISIDIGAVSIKVIVVDKSGKVVERRSCLHHCRAEEETRRILASLIPFYGEEEGHILVTGAFGRSFAEAYGFPYVEEEKSLLYYLESLPEAADFVMEMGGESARLTRLYPTFFRRENRTCAGGTGAFLENMAQLLAIPLARFDEMAKRGRRVYPIASRCGVYAKTDVQALLNDGAAREDMVLSLFHGLASQFITGLLQGSPVTGNILFLGGPFFYFPTLREVFLASLGISENHRKQRGCKEGRLYYLALGAARAPGMEDSLLGNRISSIKDRKSRTGTFLMEPGLFTFGESPEAFRERHGKAKVPRREIASHRGPVWMGIDAGSTTLKAVIMGKDGRILGERYERNRGDVVKEAGKMIFSLLDTLPERAYLASAGVTGYGEKLLKTAFHLDLGEVETMAHLKAARFFCSEVTALLDIGGQDMKYMELSRGKITKVSLNGSCASGCGSFLETFAQGMGLSLEEFTRMALSARQYPDLGHHCTVLMNTAVRKARAEGADLPSIAAALCVSVIRNALFRVIQMKDVSDMGDYPVVEGGTFYNDAVLKGFETLVGRPVIRPDAAGLMGAYGMALIARDSWKMGSRSTLISKEAFRNLHMEEISRRCGGCGNHCLVTARFFSGSRPFVTGNRCVKGEAIFIGQREIRQIPDMASWVKDHVFARHFIGQGKGIVGIPAALDMWSDFPFWRGFWESLGYRVISSSFDEVDFRHSLLSVPGKVRCHACRLAHGHVENLLHEKADFLWMPVHGRGWEDHINDERRHALYGKVLALYMAPAFQRAGIPLLAPKLPEFDSPYLAEKLHRALPQFPLMDIKKAIRAGQEELRTYEKDYANETAHVLETIHHREGWGFVLTGRACHLDPQIHKGIPSCITSMDIPVLTAEGLYLMDHPLGQGAARSEKDILLHACRRVLEDRQLQLILLHPVGCDRMRALKDRIKKDLLGRGKYYTELTLDQGSTAGALAIRLRTLKAELEEERRNPMK